MKYILILSVLLAGCLSNKIEFNSHGTYQIAAICKDGIVIGTDTRTAITNKNLEIMAFYDTVQKIYPFEDYSISSSGNFLIQGKYLPFYYKEYRDSFPIMNELKYNMLNFFTFLYYKYPLVYKEAFNNKMIFAGYENNKPSICFTRYGRYDCVRDSGYVAEDTLSEFKYYTNLTCEEAAKKIDTAICRYVSKYKKEREIGTYVSVLKIKKDNTSEWLLHPPNLELRTFKDFINAYKANRIKISFTSEQNRRMILNEIAKYQ